MCRLCCSSHVLVGGESQTLTLGQPRYCWCKTDLLHHHGSSHTLDISFCALAKQTGSTLPRENWTFQTLSSNSFLGEPTEHSLRDQSKCWKAVPGEG